MVPGTSVFLSSETGMSGNFEIASRVQVPFHTSRQKVGLLLSRCSGQGPHLVLMAYSLHKVAGLRKGEPRAQDTVLTYSRVSYFVLADILIDMNGSVTDIHHSSLCCCFLIFSSKAQIKAEYRRS